MDLCLAKIQSVVGKVHVHGKFPSIVDTVFVRELPTAGLNAHKTQFLLGPNWILL